MRITKRIEFAAAHRLENWPWSKCYNLHGHNWTLEVTVKGPILETGEIVDYTRLKEVLDRTIVSQWDHKNLNEVTGYRNTTSEILTLLAWEMISRELISLYPKHHLTLERIRLYETSSCWAEMDSSETPQISLQEQSPIHNSEHEDSTQTQRQLPTSMPGLRSSETQEKTTS